MYCKSCNQKNEDDNTFCIKCGQSLAEDVSPINPSQKSNDSGNYVLPILDLIVASILILAGIKLFNAGNAMEVLRSVSGTSVAESFYQEMGVAFQGFAFISWALSIHWLRSLINSLQTNKIIKVIDRH